MNGIVLLDKPLGMSSNHAMQRVRRLLGAQKAGHVGSLDPLATGMLPVCLGEATKIAGEIVGGRKCYQFTVVLGSRTATGDREGEIVETAPVPRLDEDELKRTLAKFLGPQQQIPPMYSAIKKGGQPLYKLARAGLEVERQPRQIEIFDLRLAAYDGAELQLEALCSKGTYVRSLGQDIAVALGTCGHVSVLRRSYVEPFEHESMQTLEAIEQNPRVLPADRGVPHLAAVKLTDNAAIRLQQGQTVQLPEPPDAAGHVRVYDDNGRFFGIGVVKDGQLAPRRLWATGVRE